MLTKKFNENKSTKYVKKEIKRNIFAFNVKTMLEVNKRRKLSKIVNKLRK